MQTRRQIGRHEYQKTHWLLLCFAQDWKSMIHRWCHPGRIATVVMVIVSVEFRFLFQPLMRNGVPNQQPGGDIQWGDGRHGYSGCEGNRLEEAGWCGREWIPKMTRKTTSSIYDSKTVSGRFMLTCTWLIYTWTDWILWVNLLYQHSHSNIESSRIKETPRKWVRTYIVAVYHQSKSKTFRQLLTRL